MIDIYESLINNKKKEKLSPYFKGKKYLFFCAIILHIHHRP